jgi:hypothetical protein
MSIAVRFPISRNSPGSPDVAVAFDILPIAIVIEVFITGHFGGDVSRTAEPVFASVAVKRPTIEVVLLADFGNIIRELINPRKPSLLPFRQTV